MPARSRVQILQLVLFPSCLARRSIVALLDGSAARRIEVSSRASGLGHGDSDCKGGDAVYESLDAIVNLQGGEMVHICAECLASGSQAACVREGLGHCNTLQESHPVRHPHPVWCMVKAPHTKASITTPIRMVVQLLGMTPDSPEASIK
jgi:hypothetical protein